MRQPQTVRLRRCRDPVFDSPAPVSRADQSTDPSAAIVLTLESQRTIWRLRYHGTAARVLWINRTELQLPFLAALPPAMAPYLQLVPVDERVDIERAGRAWHRGKSAGGFGRLIGHPVCYLIERIHERSRRRTSRWAGISRMDERRCGRSVVESPFLAIVPYNLQMREAL